MTAGETVPCGLCGKPTMMTGTKRCDACWELEGRIHRDPALARRILAECDPALPGGVTKKALIQALQDAGMVYDAGGGIMKPSVREEMDLTEEIDALYAALSNAAPGAPQQEESSNRVGYVAPKGRYVPPVLFNPYTGEPRDARDIHTDPNGALIVPPGANLVASRAAATAPQQEASELPEHETSEMHDAVMAVLYGGVARTNTDALWQAYRSALPSRAAATAPAGGVTDAWIENYIRSLPEQGRMPKLTPGVASYWLTAEELRDMLAALTTAARAAEPAIHLGAEGQKVFAETLLNPPPPTAAFLKAEESYSNLVRPEATAPAGGMTDGAERWMAIVREKADDARKNAHGLRQFEGMEAEARARELAAQYLLETAHVMVLDERHAEALAGIVDQSGRIAELRAALTTAARAVEPAQRIIGSIHIDSTGHPYARLTHAYDANGNGWTEGTQLIAASPTPPTGKSQGEGAT